MMNSVFKRRRRCDFTLKTMDFTLKTTDFTLKTTDFTPKLQDGILATRLHCTNKDVDAENNARWRFALKMMNFELKMMNLYSK